MQEKINSDKKMYNPSQSVHRTMTTHMLKNIDNFLPNNDPKSLENFPFFWISQVNGKYSQLIEKSLKKIGLDNTKRKIILSTNALGEANITEIANLSTIKLTTATKAVYRLVEEGIVEVFSSPYDERISMVKLTEKGQSLVEKIHQINHVTLSGILNSFDEKELQQINLKLKKLFDLMPNR